ncbi:TPA: hypothetical protein MC561_001527 [Escherichia coli]|nr:hypothetical protein [Escherichia coli]HBC8233274.1 hypothetical protein [Escherichia coli]HBU6662939.1 hypothetical protein [Escherichia coli]HBV8255068.1 hypothetical protein [Escherichia coli]
MMIRTLKACAGLATARKQGVNTSNDNHYHLRVLSGDPPCYGAASAQILAIYENFQAFAVSVLLLANSLF